ncbi:MAG: hypothetical protein R3C15_12770 [Thermoleophilia bacterium]
MSRLLVLGAGPAQLGLLRRARERGLVVIACDKDPAAPGFAYADRRALVSSEDEDGVERLARAEEVDGLVSPGADWPVALAARVAERLGVPHPLAPGVARVVVSKLRQRELLEAAGVPQPRHVVVGRRDDARAAADAIGYPCVVKAPDRQGQRGITPVASPEGIAAAIEAAVAVSRSGAVLIEELVPGPEVTVNAIAIDGELHPLTVTDRLVAGPPAFGVALAHAWPSAHDVADAVAVTRAAAAALGVASGPVYAQLVLGPDGARMIELAARLGGGHDAALCQAALGVDLDGLAIAAALGEPVEPPVSRPTTGACVRFLVPPVGELVAVEGLAEASGLPGVVDVGVYRRPGWRFGPLRAGADRAGYVLATGADRDAALEVADRAADLVRFRVSDGD